MVLLFLRGLGQNDDLGDCSRLEGILRGQGVEITDNLDSFEIRLGWFDNCVTLIMWRHFSPEL